MPFEMIFENEVELRHYLYRRLNLSDRKLRSHPYSGDHIYDERYGQSGHPKFKDLPDRIVLYRFSHDNLERLNIERYDYKEENPIPLDQIPDRIRTICQDARGGALPSASQLTFEDEIWQGRSYLAVVYDDPNWELLKDDGTLGAIMFRRSGKYRKNRTFYDGQDLKLELKDSSGNIDVVSGFYAINFSKDDGGDDLGKLPPDKHRHYKFDIMMLRRLSAGTLKLFPFDPTGRNTGPP